MTFLIGWNSNAICPVYHYKEEQHESCSGNSVSGGGMADFLRTKLRNKLHFSSSGSVVLKSMCILNGFLDKCLK